MLVGTPYLRVDQLVVIFLRGRNLLNLTETDRDSGIGCGKKLASLNRAGQRGESPFRLVSTCSSEAKAVLIMNCNPAARCYFTVRSSHTNGAGLVILFQAASKNGGPLYKQGSLTRSPRNFKPHYKLATHYST